MRIWAGGAVQSTAREEDEQKSESWYREAAFKVEVVLSEDKRKTYKNEELAVSETTKKGMENIPHEINN